MRLRFWRRERPDPDPSRPHAFRQIDDPGIAALAAGRVGNQNWSLTPVAVTDNFIRKSRCGVPGCGRERPDPIHQADPDA